MKLTRRLVIGSALAGTILLATALITVERRATNQLRGDAPRAAFRDETFLDYLRRDLIIAALGVLVAGVFVMRGMARPISRSVEELRDVTRALAAGDNSRRPAVDGPQEVNELAEALRRLAEQLQTGRAALETEEALLVALTESLNEGVVAVNDRQQVVRINETARQLLRLRADVPFPADYLPRDRTLRESLDAVLSGSTAEPSEVRVDERIVSLTARPLPDGGAVLALYDLTPFRRLEAVRRDFVANVSHELRTPLTVISGVMETLQDKDLPPEMRDRFMAMTESNVRRMQRIVDDLLDLSRIESGGWLPNPIPLDVNQLAADVLAPLQEAAAGKGVALRADVHADAGVVYADPTAARQVLSNLTENALRHTTSGEVVIIATNSEDGVWLGVRDTGVGISAEHLPRIFERFYRADNARSREAGGTGLGLAIVRHLVEAHGGRVNAESVPGVGTTISALFPRQDALGPVPLPQSTQPE